MKTKTAVKHNDRIKLIIRTKAEINRAIRLLSVDDTSQTPNLAMTAQPKDGQ